MSKFSLLLSSLAMFFLAIGLTGCPQADDGPPADDTPVAEEGHEDHDHGSGEQDEAAEGSDSADEGDSASVDANKEKYLADLSAEDRAAVEKQGICPVSEGSLWGMDVPVKVSVTDAAGVEHEVFLCCGGCEGAIKKDPDKYLAVLADK